MALAQWMDTGEKPFDLGDVDISRMQPFQGNKRYLEERSKETLGPALCRPFPVSPKGHRAGVRRTPFHQHLMDTGAVMGELAGWERANWFAREAQSRNTIQLAAQNFFDNVAQNTWRAPERRHV